MQLCLGKIGCDFELLQNPEVAKAASKLVCQLYGQRCDNLNEARFMLFTAKGADSLQLPPTEDAFKQHFLRANYQAAV